MPHTRSVEPSPGTAGRRVAPSTLIARPSSGLEKKPTATASDRRGNASFGSGNARAGPLLAAPTRPALTAAGDGVATRRRPDEAVNEADRLLRLKEPPSGVRRVARSPSSASPSSVAVGAWVISLFAALWYKSKQLAKDQGFYVRRPICTQSEAGRPDRCG